MTDEQIKAFAAEAVTIANRLHRDMDRLGEILVMECFNLMAPQGEKEHWRQRWTFGSVYFGFDADQVDDDNDQDHALWDWAQMWINVDWNERTLPPLPAPAAEEGTA
jgi:hypothetical protein